MPVRGTRFSVISQRSAALIAKVVSVPSIAALTVIMLLMTVDAVLRYVFHAPISGAIELSVYGLVIFVFTGMAYTSLKKGHVRVDLLHRRLQPRTQALLDSITSLITVILLALMTWQTILRAERVMTTATVGGEKTGALFIPVGPFVYLAAFGLAIWLLIILADLFNSASQVWEGNRRARLGLVAGGLLTLLVGAIIVWLPWEINHLMTGILALLLLFPLLLSGMPVGFVLLLLGFLGFSVVLGVEKSVIPLGQVPYTEGSDYYMTVIPLFILMGVFVSTAGLGRDLYHSAYKWLGHLPGGLASATVGACAGFAAVCGSTVATAATMTTVALPEMRRYKYEPSLAAGCIAAGGDIGTMIPPSVTFIIFGLLTEQSIGRLFMAGIIPGVLMAILFIATITIRCRRNPKLGPPGPRVSTKEKLGTIKGVWPVVLLFTLVMGGIYTGIFTTTEAGGMGAFGALVIGLCMRRFTKKSFIESLRQAMVTSCMCFLLLISATLFSNFIALSRLPFLLATVITEAGLAPVGVILLVLLVFLVLGTVIPSWPVMILVVPIVFPAILAMGFDPIWFGVMVVLMCEMGAVTPPVGINVFTVAGVAKDIPMSTIFRGIFPFLLALIVLASLLIAFPQIALFLPSMMIG